MKYMDHKFVVGPEGRQEGRNVLFELWRRAFCAVEAVGGVQTALDVDQEETGIACLRRVEVSLADGVQGF